MRKKTDQPRILVVEDETAIREFVSRALEFEGYSVSQAADANAGLKILKEMTVDMIVLDMQMPVRDGFSFLQERQSQLSLSAIPVLVVSAWAEASKREKAYKLGANKYMVKPFTISDLKENVALTLATKIVREVVLE